MHAIRCRQCHVYYQRLKGLVHETNFSAKQSRPQKAARISLAYVIGGWQTHTFGTAGKGTQKTECLTRRQNASSRDPSNQNLVQNLVQNFWCYQNGRIFLLPETDAVSPA